MSLFPSPEFGPYFTDRYRTPWGPAINYDGPDSGPVRAFFIGNALYWLDEFHVDALRLDATHAIHDRSPKHFLRELAERVHDLGDRLGRPLYVIAERNANDPRIVRAVDHDGYGVDAQLVDDFHRSLHALLTSERQGWYSAFGSHEHFAKAYRDGFVLTGQYSRYRRRLWGNEPVGISPNRFVVFAQCRDTVGNRPKGDRLGRLVGFEELKLAAAATILSPCTPMLFMGEEYDEQAAFHYFTSHVDAGLARSVRAGRLREFVAHNWPAPPRNPQSEPTFARSRLTRALASGGRHATLWRFYQHLLRMRRELLATRQFNLTDHRVDVLEPAGLVVSRRRAAGSEVCIFMHFGDQAISVDAELLGDGEWTVLLNSAGQQWEGPSSATGCPITLSPKSCLVVVREQPGSVKGE